MPSRITPVTSTPRRRFLLAAGVAAAGVAMPQVSRAQTAVWRFQSSWSPKDIFHDFAVDYAKRVADMAGGRMKLDVLAAGSVVPPFQMQDAVHAGVLEGGHGVADTWYRKHRAFSLFGSPPSFGWDSHSMLGWFYRGGGEALYHELIDGILRLNVVGFLSFPMPTQPLGWFRKEVTSTDNFKGMKFRTSGMAADLFRSFGADVTTLPIDDIVPAMDRDLLDAAEVNNPSSDLQLGFPDVAKVYMLGSHHRQAEAFEIIFNKGKFEALPGEFKAILRNAALAASTEQLGAAYDRYAKDLDEIRRRNIAVMRTGAAVLEAELAAWDRLIAEQSKERFFAKVIASQKAWVKRTQPTMQALSLNTAELAAAYKHFFG